MEYYPIPQSGRFDIEPFPLLELTFGQIVTLDLNEFLTGGAPSVVWSVDGGELPPGISLTEEGILSGAATGFGAYVVQVKADAGALGVATQGLGFKLPAQTGDNTVWATGTGGTVVNYSDSLGTSWRAHIFNGAGNFGATTAGAVEALVVAGGGGSGNGGGGGAGGVITRGVVRLLLSAGTYPVVVGAGGAPGTTAFGNRYGRKGSDSSFAGLVASGGGGGIGANESVRGTPDGGSGGGDGSRQAHAPGSGIFGQGFSGGLGNDNGVTPEGNGGGGGAGEPGFNYNAATRPGDGGNGIQSDITGVLRYYAGGGASGFFQNGITPSGGLGGGGSAGVAGQINTGGGAGGNFASGGSGIVIIRYKL